MDSVLSDTTVLALVECIYAAGCDPRQWQRLVGEVHAVLPGIAFTTHQQTAGSGPVAHNAGIAPEHVKSYLAHYHAQNPYSAAFKRRRTGRVYTTTDVGTREWIKRHPFYHEWLKPAGNLTYGASVVLARDGRRLIRVTFDIPDRLGHMEERCARLLARLGPHMTRAFEVNEHLGAAVTMETAFVGMLDRMDGAALVVGAHARVTALNGEAEDMLRAGRPLRIDRSGRVVFQDPHADAAFRRALAVALGSLKDGVPFVFRIPGESGELSAVVLPLRPAAGSAAAPPAAPHALLAVRRPDADAAAVPRQLLKTLYGLTAAEIDVVLQISAGSNIADAADALQVARATARNQLCAAMTKVGVHRQAELVAAVGGLAPRLRLDRDR